MKDKTEKALHKYEKALREGNVHAYLTNSCFDKCKHCYVDTVSVNSEDAIHINKNDLFHFTDLIRPGSKKQYIVFSGGDPLAHPEITDMLSHYNGNANLEIMTSGLALSPKNPDRGKLLEALTRTDALFKVASPNEPYHSITWQNIRDIKSYIKDQGFDPNKFGYPSRVKDIIHKMATGLLPPTWIGFLLNKLSGGNQMPEVIAIGRGKNLPEEQHLKGNRDCDLEDTFCQIYVNYQGKIQYCMYTCHDGFMNISELKDITDKDKAIDLILEKLSKDTTFNNIIKHRRCYFTDEIRKNQEEGK